MANWTVETLNNRVDKELMALPADCRAQFFRISELLIEHGPQHVRRPYVKPLSRKLYKMRMTGKDGIARAVYVAASGRRLIVVHAFIKKSQKTPKRNLELAQQRAKEIR